MTEKQDALQEIAALAKLNNLTIEELTRAIGDKKEAELRESGGTISRLFSYLGGILVLAGFCIFLAQYWDDFGSASRVLVTLGTGFCAYLFGLAAIGHPQFERTTTPMMLIAAAFQPAGIFVMLDEYAKGGDPLHGVLFMSGAMLIQQGLTFIAKRRTVLAFNTVFFGALFFATLMTLQEIDTKLSVLCIGASLTCISWSLGHSPHRAIAGFWYFFGAIFLLAAYGALVWNTAAEVTFLGLSAFLVFLSTQARSRALLTIGSLSMLCYIGYFSSRYLGDSLGWPFVLILTGLAFFGLGSLALRLNAKYIREKTAA